MKDLNQNPSMEGQALRVMTQQMVLTDCDWRLFAAFGAKAVAVCEKRRNTPTMNFILKCFFLSMDNTMVYESN